MIERRVDHESRKRVSEMSPEEMRQALLVSEKTDLPNKRAFEEGKASPFVAMCDVNGLKMLNDQFGYTAGDVLIKRFAETLISVGLDAYHDKGDEFLCKGRSYHELNQKLSQAQRILSQKPPMDNFGSTVTVRNAASTALHIPTTSTSCLVPVLGN